MSNSDGSTLSDLASGGSEESKKSSDESNPTLKKKGKTSKSKDKAPRTVCPKQDLPISIESKFPTLKFMPFDPADDCNPENVLAFFHNGAKLQLCHLLTIVLPSLCTRIDVEKFHIWWTTLLRYLCFIADADEDVCDLVVNQTLRQGYDVDGATRLVKLLKSLSDRYSFAMEHVFRAADRTFVRFCDGLDNGDPAAQHATNIRAVQDKFASVARFMLDAMAVCDSLLQRARQTVAVDLYAIERKLVDKLNRFATNAVVTNQKTPWHKTSETTRKHVFLFMAAAWMADAHAEKRQGEEDDNDHEDKEDNTRVEQKKWLGKFSSISLGSLLRKSNATYDQWKEEYKEHRDEFIGDLIENHLSSPPSSPPPIIY